MGKPKKQKGARYQSKKNYFARNTNGETEQRHKRARAAKAARRKAYWASPEGRKRKFDKMNTPEKLASREAAKVARDERRRQRKLNEQKAEKAPEKGKEFYSNE